MKSYGDQFLSASHFVVACEFFENAIVEVNIAPNRPTNFYDKSRILKPNLMNSRTAT